MIYFVAKNGNDSNIGSIESPWKTLSLAFNRLNPSDVLYIRGGEYMLDEAIVFSKSGTEGCPIVYSAFPGEKVVFNAIDLYFHNDRAKYPFGHETGALFAYLVSFITIRNITVKNSHGHGIAIRDADNVIIDGCTTENTFCCGISMWDTKSTRTICHHNKITDCTVIKATTWDMLPVGLKRGNEPPHEAISIAGGCYFEVCHNLVYDCDKEGIDVKEVSHHGQVHHNHVHHVDRQGLYADAWFGPLTDVDFYENHVHDCRGAGAVISVEQGENVSNVKIYNNNIHHCYGSGILFGIWGANNPRFNLEIFDNVVYHNGYGHIGSKIPENNEEFYWITGGISLLSANAKDVKIHHNIVSDNCGFQIGYSSDYLKENDDINAVFAEKNIQIYENLIQETQKLNYPVIQAGRLDKMYGYIGDKDKKTSSLLLRI